MLAVVFVLIFEYFKILPIKRIVFYSDFIDRICFQVCKYYSAIISLKSVRQLKDYYSPIAAESSQTVDQYEVLCSPEGRMDHTAGLVCSCLVWIGHWCIATAVPKCPQLCSWKHTKLYHCALLWLLKLLMHLTFSSVLFQNFEKF